MFNIYKSRQPLSEKPMNKGVRNYLLKLNFLSAIVHTKMQVCSKRLVFLLQTVCPLHVAIVMSKLVQQVATISNVYTLMFIQFNPGNTLSSEECF